MENAAVEFLLENLNHLQLYQAHLISDDAKNQIEILEKNLCFFKVFLKYFSEKSRTEEEFNPESLFRQIGEVVYQTEDAVDAIVSLATAAEEGEEDEVENYFKRAFDAPAKLLSVVGQAELILAEAKEIHGQELARINTEMENAVVELLLKKMKRLQLCNAHLISDHIKNQIQVLEKYLYLFNSFLKNGAVESCTSCGELVWQIGEIVREAEDAVARLAADKEVENAFDAPEKLLGVVQQAELTVVEVEEIHGQNHTHTKTASLLRKLKYLQLYEAHPTSDHIMNQIQVLEKNLCLFNRFRSSGGAESCGRCGELVEQIGQIVNEVDVSVSLAAETEVENASDAPEKLVSVVERVESIVTEVKENHGQKLTDIEKLQIGGPSNTHPEPKNPKQNKVSPVTEEDMIGFYDETKNIISDLMKEAFQLTIIAIAGMGGLGKTTLAREIFSDSKIEYEFPIRLWVNVSRDYRIKDIFLSMLRDLSWITEDMYDKTTEEIAKTLRARLEKEKFLIVLDDLWTVEAWDDLQAAFPKRNAMSKILITTRDFHVAKYTKPYRGVHELHFNKCYNLLWSVVLNEYKIVFGEHEIPGDLRGLMVSIASECDDLPLAVKVIGGILKKAASTGEMSTMKSIWKQVYERMRTMPREGRIVDVVKMSYDMLPYYLRPCFLYLGIFPEDFKIPAQRLTLLWIAEGFIQEKVGVRLEETAEEYLQDLIERNLVMIDKAGPTGRTKTCRIHDFVRDFCLIKAKEHFCHEIKHSDEGAIFQDSNSHLHEYRFISIHSDVVRFISSQPYSPHVRTFLHVSQEEITALPAKNVSSIPDAFKLLRVLEAKPIEFPTFPYYLTRLVHLRYIALSSRFKVLPEAISKMWNIQTIIVHTSSRTLKIKADIWNMIQLRHMQSNASIILEKSTGEADNNNTCKNIQTLTNISPESCTQVFERATNLKKLGIRGRLATLMEDEGGPCLFDGLQKLGHLEKLKLLNDVTEIPLPGLPPVSIFPLKLMSLTLSNTFLDWKHMSVLSNLENLEVLKLKNSAFMGERWDADDQNGFHQLQVLQVEYSNLVEWAESYHHFPKLQYLKMRNCEKLKELPISLAHVSSLREIHLYRTTKSAIASAKEIKEMITGNKGRRLELSIFPLEDQA